MAKSCPRTLWAAFFIPAAYKAPIFYYLGGKFSFMKKPLILVSNDDGIAAPGLTYLVGLAKKIGKVVVVAPAKGRSGQSHAVTVNKPIFLEKTSDWGQEVESYVCSGTPVDCIKIALNEVLESKPDLCLCGINHGSNAAINVMYSGTMSGAMEGAIKGIPSVGFSIFDDSWDCDFSGVDDWILQIITNTLKNGLPWGTTLNVNFPAKTKEDYKGIKICRQAKSYWQEIFERRKHPVTEKKYYWLDGNFKNLDNQDDLDIAALKENYISVVPVQWDLTDKKLITTLKNWNL